MEKQPTVHVSKQWLHGVLRDLERHRRLAFTDALTGLANRRQFSRALGQASRAFRKEHESFAVVMLDLRGFRAANLRGHHEGDRLLAQFARRLDGSVKNDRDLCARFGGDEFLVLLRNFPTGPALKRVCDRLSGPWRISLGRRSYVLTAYVVGRRASVANLKQIVRLVDADLKRRKATDKRLLRAPAA